MKTLTLEEIIYQYILTRDTSSNQKWHNVLCKLCGDHGRKGKRAGFHFENHTVVYHCFNCGCVAKFDPAEHGKIPKTMLAVLRSFNVPDDVYKRLQLSMFGKSSSEYTYPTVTLVEPPVIPLPSKFCYLKDTDSKWADVAREYLEHERGIDYNNYPFMICSQLEEWSKRLIIPIYKDEKLIYYQGRDLTYSDASQRYLSPPIEKNKVLYGFDRLLGDNKTPLFITEGFFDAFLIDGVALLGKEISPFQRIWLDYSQREKIYIPDKQNSGKKAAFQALGCGWAISTPDIGNCKDINESYKKYGKLYIIKSIMEHKCKGLKAKTSLNQYCK